MFAERQLCAACGPLTPTMDVSWRTSPIYTFAAWHIWHSLAKKQKQMTMSRHVKTTEDKHSLLSFVQNNAHPFLSQTFGSRFVSWKCPNRTSMLSFAIYQYNFTKRMRKSECKKSEFFFDRNICCLKRVLGARNALTATKSKFSDRAWKLIKSRKATGIDSRQSERREWKHRKTN